MNNFFKSTLPFTRIIKLILPANNVIKDAGRRGALSDKLSVGGAVEDDNLVAGSVSDDKHESVALIMEPFAVGSLLAPFGVDTNDFCRQFNNLSEVFDKNLPLRVFLWLLPERKFLIDLKPLVAGVLLRNYMSINNLLLVDFYKIFLVWSYTLRYSRCSCLRMLFGTIRSFSKSLVLYGSGLVV